MAKYYGTIGYGITEESDPENHPGVWTETIVQRAYYGDVIRNTSKWNSSGGVNDNIVLSNQISIVADAFAYNNFKYIRYIVYEGVKWKVTSIDVRRPRLMLTLGEVYND